jgi:hypothetical protein
VLVALSVALHPVMQLLNDAPDDPGTSVITEHDFNTASLPAVFGEQLVTGTEVAEDSRSIRVPSKVLPTPTAATAMRAFWIKFLLFADSIVDSRHAEFVRLFSDIVS